MTTALDNYYTMKSKDQVEHIELRDYRTSMPINTSVGKERRESNRVIPPTIRASRVIKQDFLKIWRRVQNRPCKVENISFSGIGIRSKDLMRINDIVELELSTLRGDISQSISVRIRNHYRDEDGSYSYGGSLENVLNKHFRRMIGQQLTG